LPEGWTWARLSELGKFGRGKSRHRPRDDPRLYGGAFPFIQTGEVRRSHGRITDYERTYNDFGLAQSKLWPAGTVCITIAANIAASGILAFDACFPDSVVGLIPSDESIGKYVEYFMRTAREQLDRYAPATAQKNINLQILESVRVPLPSSREVNEIVRQLDLKLSAANELTAEIKRHEPECLRARSSVLSSAFAGRLTAQVVGDEPASLLLERLRAGRSSGGRRGRKPTSDDSASARRLNQAGART
jgi:type I restriction enzyme S subunit